MNQANTGLRLPVQAAVDRTANYSALAGGGVQSSQNPQQILTGISQLIPSIVQALPTLIGAFL